MTSRVRASQAYAPMRSTTLCVVRGWAMDSPHIDLKNEFMDDLIGDPILR
jgi:hypothetical protein